MRPVNKLNPHINYQPPKHLHFKGQARVHIYNLFQKYDPTLEDCLEKWLEFINKILAQQNISQDEKEAKKAIEAKVTDIYKQAGVPLTQALGSYCSYCESPISGLLEVEHIAPKAEYPTYATNWENFLLACNPCNRPKGKNPSRIEVEGWLPPKKPRTETAYYDEIRNHYVWPDWHADSYNWLPADLYVNDQWMGWQKVNFADAVNINNKLVSIDIATRTVKADLPKLGLQNVEVRVELSDGTGTGQGKKMIDLCALNDTGNKAGTYDRRVLNRTRAWFTILMTLNNIFALQSLQQNTFDRLLWPTVLIVATQTGFYSLWVRILGQYRDPTGHMLDSRFVAETNYPLYFPNTNTSNLP